MATHNPTFHSLNKCEEVKKIKVNVIDKSSKKHVSISLYAWATVGWLKNKIKAEFGIEPKNQILSYCNYELTKNNMPLISYSAAEKWTVYLQQPTNQVKWDFVRVLDAFDSDEHIDRLLEVIREGALRYQPRMTSEGTSGTYFLLNKHKEQTGIFKPIDEEAYAPNNPRGFVGQYGTEAFKKGIQSGEGGVREVAAYIIDKLMGGYSRVPPTTLVEIRHPYFDKKTGFFEKEEAEGEDDDAVAVAKQLEFVMPAGTRGDMSVGKKEKVKIGSLQKFVKHNDVSSNFGYSAFDVDEVHRIAILDLRILNCDRNDENMLVRFRADPDKKKKNELIPIDHGLSLPDRFEISKYDIVWMDWPQARMPFNEKEIELIRKMNPVEDAKELQRYIVLREDCWRNCVLANIVLKVCALRGGLSPADVGNILYKEDEDSPAEINKIIDRTMSYIKILQARKNGFFNTEKKSKSDQKKSELIPGQQTVGTDSAHQTSETAKGQSDSSEEEKKIEFLSSAGKKRPRAMSMLQADDFENLVFLSPTPGKKTGHFQSRLDRPSEEDVIAEQKGSDSTSSNHEGDDDGKETIPTTKQAERVVLKKSISLHDIKASATETSEPTQAPEKKVQAKTRKYDDKYYELFFYYFEAFLEKYLLSKFGPKPQSGVGNRPHSSSVQIESPISRARERI